MVDKEGNEGKQEVGFDNDGWNQRNDPHCCPPEGLRAEAKRHHINIGTLVQIKALAPHHGKKPISQKPIKESTTRLNRVSPACSTSYPTKSHHGTLLSPLPSFFYTLHPPLQSTMRIEWRNHHSSDVLEDNSVRKSMRYSLTKAVGLLQLPP